MTTSKGTIAGIPSSQSTIACFIVNSALIEAVTYTVSPCRLLITDESRYGSHTPVRIQEVICHPAIITAHKIVNTPESNVVNLASFTTRWNPDNQYTSESFSLEHPTISKILCLSEPWYESCSDLGRFGGTPLRSVGTIDRGGKIRKWERRGCGVQMP
jgi:hypothetical protein